MSNFTSLEIRKLADYSDGERVERFHPESGAKFLADPDTLEPRPWPLAGVALINETLPRHTRMSTNVVKRGQAEGWLELRGMTLAHRPGGPPEDPWRITHTFVQAEEIVINTITGPVVYRVTRQPDKFAAREIEVINPTKDLMRRIIEPDKKVTSDIYAAAETDVAWYYELMLSSGVESAGAAVEAADFVFNRAKGRGHQWAVEINASAAPYANSALIVSLWRRGSGTDAALKDYDDVAALEGDAQAAELVSGTNANYGRKTLIDATPVITVDDTNDWVDIDFPDQTWTALGAGGTAITDLLTAFDNDTTAGTDAAQVPWMFSAFAVTPDGSDVTAVLPTGGLFRAQ